MRKRVEFREWQLKALASGKMTQWWEPLRPQPEHVFGFSGLPGWTGGVITGYLVPDETFGTAMMEGHTIPVPHSCGDIVVVSGTEAVLEITGTYADRIWRIDEDVISACGADVIDGMFVKQWNIDHGEDELKWVENPVCWGFGFKVVANDGEGEER